MLRNNKYIYILIRNTLWITVLPAGTKALR